MRFVAILALGLATCDARVRAEDDPLKQALALEASIQKVVEQKEASVACLLVSRSDRYDDVGDRRPKIPGKLGSYTPPQPGGWPNPQGQELAKRLNLAAPDVVPDSYGSGVVIDDVEGLILTNYHVIRDATKVYVRLPNQRGSYADVHAADERSDLAVLKLIDRPPGLHKLEYGDGDKVKKGQFVISLANPWAAGFRDGSPSVSWGMLSNVRRRLPGEHNPPVPQRPRLFYYPVLLQTNLNVAPGCSGGALLDLRGRWIGLLTGLAGVAGGEGSGGYAIPLDARMKGIIEKLRKGEEVEYGFLGIAQPFARGPQGFQRNNDWRPTPGGPAAKAGMQIGDVIISVNGEPVHEQDDMLLFISAALAGSEVSLEVQSSYNGERRVLRPVLHKTSWPTTGPIIAANRPKPVHGLRVDFGSVIYQGGGGFGREEGIPQGVIVREVEKDSPAAKAGLKADQDLITAVNGRTVQMPRDFYRLAAATRGSLELTVKEGERGEPRQVKLP